MSSASAILTPSRSLNSLNRDELTKLCKEFSLKATGKNALLVQRLRGHAQSLPPDAPLSISARILSNDPKPPQKPRLVSDFVPDDLITPELIHPHQQYKGFVELSLDIHLRILGYLQALDILSFGQCSRKLATVTKNRVVWTQAFEKALEMQHIPPSAYAEVIKNASIPTLMGMASIPSRLSRKFRLGGTLGSHAKTTIHPPGGHKIDFFRLSPDSRVLIMHSVPVKGTGKKAISIWDLGADSGQLPVLRYQNELDDEKSLKRQMVLERDGRGLLLCFVEPSKPDETPKRTYFKTYPYRYSEHSLPTDTNKWCSNIVEPSSIHSFGCTFLLTWHATRSMWTPSASWTADDPYLVNFSLPPELAAFDGYHMTNRRGLLVRKSGFAVYSLPKEKAQEPLHPIISLTAPLGEKLRFPSLTPLDLPPLPFDYQTQFIVDVSLQGHIRWCQFSDSTIGDVHVDCMPKYVGSTILANHKLTGGSYVPWGCGFIATVRSPLAAVMVDESDLEKAFSLNFDIPASLVNESTVFSPIHGNVYVLPQDKSGITIYHLFRRPPPF